MREFRCSEDDESHHHEKHSEEPIEADHQLAVLKRLFELGIFSQEDSPLAIHDQSKSLNGSKNRIVPTNAMPETACHHCYPEVAPVQKAILFRTTQRNVDVISEPEGERHVPASPEVCEVFCKIR